MKPFKECCKILYDKVLKNEIEGVCFVFFNLDVYDMLTAYASGNQELYVSRQGCIKECFGEDNLQVLKEQLITRYEELGLC